MVTLDIGISVASWGWGSPDFSHSSCNANQLAAGKFNLQSQCNDITWKWHNHIGNITQGCSSFWAKLCGLRVIYHWVLPKSQSRPTSTWHHYVVHMFRTPPPLPENPSLLVVQSDLATLFVRRCSDIPCSCSVHKGVRRQAYFLWAGNKLVIPLLNEKCTLWKKIFVSEGT